ncbi:hypothetical protein LCGC14_0561420 [marine sediment metagenome]|uniref:Uncharacterized protein n=1 Tax=marine sediment metagenome TaxID=412755 RepID=A0A0F9RLV0_9ZZZZ
MSYIPKIGRATPFLFVSVIVVVWRNQVILILQMDGGKFKPGPDTRRNTKGRPACGRSKALALVDVICKKPKNLMTLKEALQVHFDKDPVTFFQTIIVPLTPKESYNAMAAKSSEWATKTPMEIAKDMTARTIGELPGPSEPEPTGELDG